MLQNAKIQQICYITWQFCNYVRLWRRQDQHNDRMTFAWRLRTIAHDRGPQSPDDRIRSRNRARSRTIALIRATLPAGSMTPAPQQFEHWQNWPRASRKGKACRHKQYGAGHLWFGDTGVREGGPDLYPHLVRTMLRWAVHWQYHSFQHCFVVFLTKSTLESECLCFSYKIMVRI